MEHEIKVSVVIAAYNAEKYIRECLESLTGQTLRDIEIIVINDGSTDATAEIVEECQKHDEKIRLYSQKNQGAGPARNHGMEKARGKYLLILDADDYFVPDMCETLYRYAEEKRAEIVIFGAYGQDVETGKLRNMHSLTCGATEEKDRVFSAEEMANHIFQMTFTVAWNRFYLRDFVRKHAFYFQSVRIIDDLFFAVWSLACAKRICFYDRAFLYHRENNIESQIGNSSRYPQSCFQACKAVREKLEQEKIYDVFQESYLNLALQEQITQLGRMGTMQAFLEAYQNLKDGGFDELGICQDTLLMIHSNQNREEYRRIMELSAEKYLFDKMQRVHEALGEFYLFPHLPELKAKRIILYGAGIVGRAYYSQCLCSSFCRVALWVDQDYESLQQEGLPVNSPDMIAGCSCDYILIAQLQDSVAEKIREGLISLGIPESIIRYCHPIKI